MCNIGPTDLQLVFTRNCKATLSIVHSWEILLYLNSVQIGKWYLWTKYHAFFILYIAFCSSHTVMDTYIAVCFKLDVTDQIKHTSYKMWTKMVCVNYWFKAFNLCIYLLNTVICKHIEVIIRNIHGYYMESPEPIDPCHQSCQQMRSKMDLQTDTTAYLENLV